MHRSPLECLEDQHVQCALEDVDSVAVRFGSFHKDVDNLQLIRDLLGTVLPCRARCQVWRGRISHRKKSGLWPSKALTISDPPKRTSVLECIEQIVTLIDWCYPYPFEYPPCGYCQKVPMRIDHGFLASSEWITAEP